MVFLAVTSFLLVGFFMAVGGIEALAQKVGKS